MRLRDTQDTDVLEQHYARQSRYRLIITTAFLVIAVLASVLFADRSGEDLLSWKNGQFSVTLPDGSGYSVAFEDIESLRLVEQPDFGACVSGDSGKTLKYGIWENSSLGSYVLCAHQCFDVVIQVDTPDRIFWIGYESADTTRLLYDNFSQEVAAAKQAPQDG